MVMSGMNGKIFCYFTDCDFFQEGRREQIGRHTSLETARRAVRRMAPSYGNLYIRDLDGRIVETILRGLPKKSANCGKPLPPPDVDAPDAWL